MLQRVHPMSCARPGAILAAPAAVPAARPIFSCCRRDLQVASGTLPGTKAGSTAEPLACTPRGPITFARHREPLPAPLAGLGAVWKVGKVAKLDGKRRIRVERTKPRETRQKPAAREIAGVLEEAIKAKRVDDRGYLGGRRQLLYTLGDGSKLLVLIDVISTAEPIRFYTMPD